MNILGKSFYITSGVLLSLVGFGAMGLSAMHFIEPVKPVNYQRVKEAKINFCAVNFANNKTYMNMAVERKGDTVTFLAHGLKEWEGKFNMVSQVESQCEGLGLTKMCFGENCNVAELSGNKAKPVRHNGLYFELTYDDKHIDPRIERNWN